MALGVTSGKRGIYNGHPVYEEGQDTPIGVVVIKTPPDPMENEFEKGYDGVVLLTDPHGIVFISNRQEWVLHTISKLSPEEINRIEKSQQFGQGPWRWTGLKAIDEEHVADNLGNKYFVHKIALENYPGWDLIFLVDINSIIKRLHRPLIKISGYLIITFCVLVGLAVFFLYYEANLEIDQRVITEKTLIRAHDDLEKCVEERTFELMKSVDDLQKEIVERKQVEEALRESEKKYRTLAENLCVGVFRTTPGSKGNIIEVNSAYMRMFGFDNKETLLSLYANNLYQNPEDRYRFSNKLLKDGAVNNEEIMFKRRDGTSFCGSVTAVAVKGNDGKVSHYDGIIEDITEQNKIRDQLQQSQKMEAIGTLAGGIAHDFNNILAGIIGYTELALKDVQNNESTKMKLDRALEACGRATDLVKQILSFSRIQKSEPKPVIPYIIIKEVLKLMRASLPATIEIKQSLGSECYVIADATNIHQVFLNLCTNAAHAMKQSGGVLSVSLKNVTLDHQDLVHHIDVIPGDFIRISVEDTGIGMTKDVQEKAFDPFFTTKELGEGTGMGLAAVHGIVTELGGYVSLNSEPDQGTAVDVFIPLVSDPAEIDRSMASTPLKGGTERVMFVDDEEIQIELAEQILSQHGYQVTAFSDGIIALKHFQQDPDAYDLIITDMTMPKMTGDSLTKRVHLIRPDIPVIMCTGFSDIIDEKKAYTLGINAFLYKPVVMADLLETIRKVLDGVW